MRTAPLASPHPRRPANRLRRSCTAGLLASAAAILVTTAGAQAPPGAPLKWRERLNLWRPDVAAKLIVAVAFSPDGTLIVTAHEGGTVRVWDARTGKDRAPPLPDHDRPSAVQFTRDGKTILIADARGVKRRDAATLKEIDGMSWDYLAERAVAFDPSGKWAAASWAGGAVLLWKFTRKPQRPVGWRADAPSEPADRRSVSAVAFSPDGLTLATGNGDGTIKLWDVASRTERASFRPPRGGRVKSLAFTPDGKALASNHGLHGIHVWDLVARKEGPALKGRKLTYTCLAVGPDGRTLAAGAANGVLRMWDLATGDILHTFKPHLGQIRLLAFAANGKALASVGMEASVKVWRPEAPLAEAPPEPKVTAGEMEGLLQDLRAADSVRALQAVQALAGTPRQTLAVFKKRLRPVEPVPAETIARLLADLDSTRYPVRTRANRELERYVDRARPQLAKALAGGVPLEVRQRILALLERLDRQDTPELAFQRRAVEVLEKIASREARDLLTALASGMPEAYLTRYAQQALQRLDD